MSGTRNKKTTAVFILAAVLPKLQPALGLNDEQAGTIATAFMFGYFLTSPIFGSLGDRAPRPSSLSDSN